MTKHAHTISFLFSLLFCSLFFCSPGYGGGLAMYEIGPAETALASAGWASRAEDASTLFTNPAGMTRIKKSEFLTGAQGLYTDLSFSSDSRTTTMGSHGDTRRWLPTGDMYYVHSISPDLKVGIGLLGYFGLSIDYGNNWVGRYYMQSGELQGITIQPSVAYKITDNISLGLGLNAMRATLKSKVAINNALDSLPDGRLELDDTTWGYGANVGILYELNKGTRFGVNYLSEVKLDFSPTTDFSGTGPLLTMILARRGLINATVDMTMRVPQMVMFSFYYEVNPCWAVMGDVGWQQWSRFGKVDVGIYSADPRSLTADLNYKDTWHYALGAQYRAAQPWLLMFGISYDTSAVKGADMSVSMPMGESYRFGAGAEYKIGEHLSILGAYELVWLNTLNVDQQRGPSSGRVAGEYKNAQIHALQVGLRYQF